MTTGWLESPFHGMLTLNFPIEPAFTSIGNPSSYYN